MADVLRQSGILLSEATCFGLGSGLAFLYAHNSRTPTRFILGRGYLMEHDLCESLGVTLREEREADPARAWSRVRERVDAGVPIILSTDLAHLPYWGSQAGSFNGHRIVLAGHDADRGVAFVADTDKAGIQSVTLADLSKARASEGPPVGYTENEWWEIDVSAQLRPMGEAVRDSLHRQAERLLRDPSGFGGCDALDRFAAELPEWPQTLPDFPAVAIDAYKNIEKRGTGGGLFRRLYAEFLLECERAGHVEASRGLADRAMSIAEAWTRVGLSLRSAGQGEGRFDDLCRSVTWLAKAERELAISLETA
jgi:hypothetical protein